MLSSNLSRLTVPLGAALYPSPCATIIGSRASISFFNWKSPKSEDFSEVEKLGAEDASLVPAEEAEKNLFIDPVRGPLPIITKRDLTHLPMGRAIRQAWVENLDTVEEKKLGLIDLHPDVFACFPRVDIINTNVTWQRLFKYVNWNWTPTRGEFTRGNKKPWPQKGLGKARHGSRVSPIWLGGGKAHGPRGPKTHYHMLPYDKRVTGLTSTLSVKFAQDDIKFVDSLDIPTEDPQYLQDLVEARKWGVSVLFIDDTDLAPKNLALATHPIYHMNIMPVYGLNVISMLKHETLVLTLAALNKIEERLIKAINRHDPFPPMARKIPLGAYH